ncbi:hypothetical protein K8R42_02940 [bacterium]|nr:hypothetical protein [bacterium]
MKLSKLQKFILKQSWQNKKPRVPRSIFENFYNKQKNPPSAKIRANIITKSIERLIDKGLLVGFGEKTQYKLFISQVRLTISGKKIAQTLFGQQTQLPFKKRRK